MSVHFTNLLIVVAAAFASPLVLGLVPALRLPSVVVEILAGIVLGPSVLGWVGVDQAVEVLATIGLAFLLFLAGLEISSTSCADARSRSRRSATCARSCSPSWLPSRSTRLGCQRRR